MSRFYTSPGNVDSKRGVILITGGEAHHIIDVLRLREADKIVVFDGTGAEYAGFIETLERKQKKVIVKVVRSEEPSPELKPEVHLIQAIPRKARMDYIVEKSTELGVSVLIPALTSRTVVRPDTASAARRLGRWRRLAAESAKQCGRRDVPEIRDITGYSEVISDLDSYDAVFLACLYGDTVPLAEALCGLKSGKVAVLIGPEGDFTPEEIHMSETFGNCRRVSLGKNVLKADTAGLFVLSVLAYEFSRTR